MTCLSNLVLDELVVGELAHGHVESARGHLDGCARCRTRLVALEDDRRAFRSELPPRPRRRRWIAATAAASAAAAAIVFALLPRGGSEPVDTVRAKGPAHMAVYVARGSGGTRLATGDRVRAGETLQMTVTLREPRHLTLIGIDGTTRATVYFPDGPLAAPFGPGEDVALPFAIRLDATPGRERFFAVFCAGALPIEPLRAAIEAGVPPGNCTVDPIELVKEAP